MLTVHAPCDHLMVTWGQERKGAWKHALLNGYFQWGRFLFMLEEQQQILKGA